MVKEHKIQIELDTNEVEWTCMALDHLCIKYRIEHKKAESIGAHGEADWFKNNYEYLDELKKKIRKGTNLFS